MILTGHSIAQAVAQGHIEIDPFDPARVNPASYDLLLGDEVAIYTADEHDFATSRHAPYTSAVGFIPRRQLDSKKEQSCTRLLMDKRRGFTIEPGQLYLMHTRERIHTRRYVPVIDGKSSIGRLGVFVHVTAGYGDPGFNGQYTLEVATIAHPVVVYPGMRFAQVRFHHHSASADEIDGFLPQYNGNYTGDAARGPVRSASWKQFATK